MNENMPRPTRFVEAVGDLRSTASYYGHELIHTSPLHVPAWPWAAAFFFSLRFKNTFSYTTIGILISYPRLYRGQEVTRATSLMLPRHSRVFAAVGDLRSSA